MSTSQCGNCEQGLVLLDDVLGVVTSLDSVSVDFAQAISDFDLSVFGSPDVSINCSFSDLNIPVSVIPTVSNTDSLIYRLSQIEEKLGIFCLAIWSGRSLNLIEFIISLCRNDFNWDVSTSNFIIVHRLEKKRNGMLFRVSFLRLKQQILLKSVEFELRGIFVGLK